MKMLLLALLSALPTTLLAQSGPEEFQAALLQTKTGALVAYNGTSQHAFTVRVVGEVTPTEKPNMVTVNGLLLQVATVAYGSNGDVSELSEDTQKKFLLSYQQHEALYLREELKITVQNEKTAFRRFGNHLFLAWEYEMPARGKNKVRKQLYLVALCFNQALVLNCPLLKTDNEASAQTLLSSTAATLLRYDHPLDLAELYKQLQAE